MADYTNQATTLLSSKGPWGQPTGAVVILITVLLLVVLGLIELIGRPVARAETLGHV